MSWTFMAFINAHFLPIIGSGNQNYLTANFDLKVYNSALIVN